MLAGEWSSAWQRFAEGGERKQRQGHNRTEQEPHTVPVSIRRNGGFTRSPEQYPRARTASRIAHASGCLPDAKLIEADRSVKNIDAKTRLGFSPRTKPGVKDSQRNARLAQKPPVVLQKYALDRPFRH